ncbi:hypothetical protein [Streptomyces actuosus]|uniref:hypothetical protein n=1 Tax=Streptomyces actuosus TaxID=1885 RepID=UPI003F686176
MSAAEHRQSKKRRHIAWAAAGAVVVAGGGIAAQRPVAATARPAQRTSEAIATARNRADLPGSLWYALWDKKYTTTGDRPWAPGRTPVTAGGHPCMVNSKETRNGHTITVDLDTWDAPVAIVGRAGPGARDRTGPRPHTGRGQRLGALP